MQDIPFIPLVALGTLVFTFVNFLKFVSAKDWNAALTQVIAWAAGVAGILLFAHTDFGDSVTVAGRTLGSLSGTTQVYLGLMATSLLSTVNELKKAFDNSDTASTPPLLSGLTKKAP